MPASPHCVAQSAPGWPYPFVIGSWVRAAARSLSLLLCCLPAVAPAQTVVSAVRVWPAAEYTRITFESAQPIEYTVFTAKNPERLVVDMEDVELGRQLRSLPE